MTTNNLPSSVTNWQSHFEIYPRDDPVYQRLICRWNEEKEGTTLQHIYHAVINTINGDIFMDCRKRKIFVKQVVQTIVRPIQICLKTAWHASIIGPLAAEYFDCLSFLRIIREDKKGFDLERFKINILRSCLDIMRTPLYGVAMLVTGLAALMLGMVNPNSLYRTRDLVGKLERKLLRVDNILDANVIWIFTLCFNPLKNILSNTPENMKEKILPRFVKNQIDFRRNNAGIFNGMQRLPPDQAYVSIAAPKTAAT